MRVFAPFILLALSGCSSLNLPEMGALGEMFRDTSTDLSDTPDIASAPVVPSDLRSAAEWDQAAKSLQAERESFAEIGMGEPLGDLDADVERLKAEVRAYKLDDPQPGN